MHSAIDTNPRKEAAAKKFGGDAVEFINPSDLPEGKRIQDYLVEITDGGLDFTFDATGNVSVWHLICVVIEPNVSLSGECYARRSRSMSQRLGRVQLAQPYLSQPKFIPDAQHFQSYHRRR